jgi:hypothetical protein
VFGLIGGANDAAAAPVNIVQNGGFEAATTFDGWTVVDQQGSGGTWCPQTGTDAPGLTFDKGGFTCGGKSGSGATVPAPPEGSTAAMMDQGDPAASALYQCVDILAGSTSAELSFQLYLLNLAEEWTTHPTLDLFAGGGPIKPGIESSDDRFSISGGKGGATNQQFRADLVTPEGIAGDPFTVDVLQNIYQTQPGDPLESGYELITADLSAYIGQSVCVRFVVVDNDFYLNAGVDDVQLIVDQPDAPTTVPLSPIPTAEEGPIAAPDTGTGSETGSPPTLLFAVAALLVTITGAGALAYARRR